MRVFVVGGSCHVEGHCLRVCLFDCRSVDLHLGRGKDHILTDQVGGGGGGVWGLGRVRLSEGCRNKIRRCMI